MKNLALALAVVAAVISFISLGNNVGGFKMNKSYSHSNDVSIGSSEDVSRKSLESFNPGGKGFESFKCSSDPAFSEEIPYNFVSEVTSMESLFEYVSEDAKKNMENFVLRYDAEGDPYSDYNLELMFKLKNNIPIE